MTEMWQMSKQMFAWLLGQPDEEMQCRCDWQDDEDNEVDESSGLGTVIAIYMALAGLFIGAYLIPSQLTQGSRSQRREQQQQQQERARLGIEVTKKATLTLINKRNMLLPMMPETLDNWQDVLMPQSGEEVSRLIQAQQHNLICALNDQQQLRQLQQQLMLTLSLQDVFYDLSTDDSDEDQFRDIPSEMQLIPISTAVVHLE